MASADLIMSIQVIVSFAMGALIGLERELRHSPAGIRTYAAVCMGACIFGIVSTHPVFLPGMSAINVDTTRVAAQVASGVGFIGAGVIFKEGLNTIGLTTAATIWATASVGLAVAFNLYFVAVISMVLIVFTLNLGVFPGFKKIKRRSKRNRFE